MDFFKTKKGRFINMNFTSKIFILILLTFIIGISAVSASDDIGDNVTLSESSVSLDDSNYDVELVESSPSDSDVLSASPGTFSYLQELIDNDTEGTITLDRNYAYNNRDDSALLSGIVINRSLVINGAGHSIDGKSKARIFNISHDNVIIENLTLQAGYKSDDAGGAAILWNGDNARLKGCTFTNNIQASTSYEYGMCVYYSGSDFLIDNCLFKTTAGGGWRNGLYLTGGNVTIINSEFNRLNSFIVIENLDKINITRNKFLNEFNGGGPNTYSGIQRPLYMKYVNNVSFCSNYFSKSAAVNNFVDLTNIKYIDFINNTFYDMNWGSRGIYIYHLGYCNFSDNNLTKIPAGFSAYQCGIYSNGINGNGTAYIKNNTFDQFTSNYAHGLRVQNHKTIYLYNNTFSNSEAVTQSSEQDMLLIYNINNAIIYDNIFDNITSYAHTFYSYVVNNLNFYDNSFYNCGDSGQETIGRICRIYTTNGNFTNNNFTLCYCNAPEDSNIIGAVCSFERNSRMNFTHNNISNFYSANHLQSIQGLLYIESNSGLVNVTDNIFSDNVYDCTSGTGVIHSKVNCNILDNTFENNIIVSDGGAVYNEGANSNISDNRFISNSVTNIGGAIYNSGNGVTISYNNFTDIHADADGGVIYSSGNNVLIHHNNITDCYANIAGALYISGNNANVSSNYFNNINAVNYGVLYSDSLNSIFENNTYLDNYAESDGVVALQNGVTLNHETFTGNYVTNGQAGTIIFIGDNNNVNNTYINDTSALVGGAIVNNGNHNSMNNVTIDNTRATGTFGGAIYSAGDYFNVTGLNVSNSYALNDGGAIYSAGAYGTLSNSSFDLVCCGHDGGVIYWTGDYGEGYGINITNVNATRNGGAIFWVGADGYLSDINITNSTAYGEGGAVYWTGPSGTISKFDIKDIHVNGGAAISWTGVDGTIENGLFSYIYAIGDGGAIYIIGAGATLSSINFTHINSTANGGAIYGTSIDSFMENLMFNDVNSTANGGAIFWTGSNCNAYNLVFIETHSPTNGGAIYWTGSKSSIKSSKFENVTAGISGGSVYWAGAESNFTDVNFTNTFSEMIGGAIFWSGISGTIKQANFNVTRSNAGGAISWNADNGTLIDVNFTNTNSSTGGAVYWIGENPTFYILNITGSNATSKGGAIYLSGSNADLHQLYLENNYAGTDGGAINFEGVSSKLYDSQFINNTADAKAGAVAWLSSDGEIYNNNFTNNTGAIGGAIYVNADDNYLHDLDFTNNTADIGGALYVSGLKGNRLFDSNFTNNNASTTGGAIYWFSADSQVGNVRIDGANAVHGGAIYWVGTDGTLSDLYFNNVYAKENGGAMYILGSTVSIDGADFYNINATDGGGIYWIGHYGNLENANFENNSVTNNGGGLYVAGNNFEMNHATFTHNNASNYGAGIFWSSSGKISNVEMSYNRAHSGSAIYNGGELTLINASILNNKADIRSIEVVTNETSTDFVAIAILRGYDNLLNGIWTNSKSINVQNVTYWGANGTMKTPNRLITPAEGASETADVFFDTCVAGINASICIYNDDVETNGSGSSDVYGRVFCSIYKYETTFNITAVHDEDLYYTGTQIKTSANSSKLNATLAISLPEDIPFNSNAPIQVTLVDEINHIGVGLNGTVSIYLDGEFWMNVTVVNGNATIYDVIPRETGYYNISAHYDGGYFGTHRVEELYSNVANFYIVKAALPISISINSTDIHVGDIVAISISGPSNYTGKVQYVAGDYFDFVDLNTTYTFNATYNSGIVHVFAFALGDKNYLSGVDNLSFEVFKNDLSMEFVNISDISVGDLAVITVKFDTDDVTGNILVNVNDTYYNATVSGGYAHVTIYDLTDGDYDVSARYMGSYYYYEYGNITTEFKVSKINTNVAVEVNSDVHVGENAIISINVTSNNTNHLVNGYVTVSVGGNQYNVSVTNGVASLVLDTLSAGDNPISVSYFGDHQFNGNTADSNIFIEKVGTSISAEVIQSPIYSSEEARFNIYVNSDIIGHIVNGFVTATIAGREYNVSINNGVGHLTVPALAEEVYNLSISYAGDAEFDGINNDSACSITVERVSVSYVTAISKPIYVGQDAVIDIKLFSDVPKYVVNGYVNVNVNGVTYKTPIINGTGSLTIYNLPEGSYPVSITYEGDNQFKNNTFIDVAYVNVNKINIASINVTPEAQVINVTESATLKINLTSAVENFTVNGIVTVNVGNNEYYTSVIDGVGYLTVYNLDEGVYNIRVMFDGDDQFNPRSFPNVASITVKKMDVASIVVTPKTQVINVTDKATFTVTATTDVRDINDFVTLTVGDKEYVIRLIDGVGVLSIDDLLEGNYSISVSYAGDNYFNPYSNSNISNVSVNKINIRDITVSVVNDTIDVGDDSVFIFDVNSDDYIFDDYITVNVLNNTYTVPITNNRGYLTIYSLQESIDAVNISYEGNSQFNKFNKTGAVTTTVNKVNNVSLNITPKSQNIKVGDDAIFNISLTAGDYVINGYVTVSIAGKNYTVPIIGNNGSLVVSGLYEGNYTLNVTYAGDYQFNATSIVNASEVKVKKIDISDITVKTVSPIYAGDNAVFNVTLVSDYVINGNVIARIAGQDYNVSISNNKGSFLVSGLNNGTYAVSVSYPGDYKFNPYTKPNACNVVVKKLDVTSINVTPALSEIYVGQDANLDIVLVANKTINGYVTVNVGNNSYNVSIADNRGYLKVSNLKEGSYGVNVTYGGNSQINKLVRNNAASIIVSRVNIDSIKVTPQSSSIFVGQNETFTITLTPEIENYVVNGYVNVTINNKNYTVPIVDNKGVFVTPALQYGSYGIEVSYAGDNTFNSKPNEELAHITVDKVNISSIIVDPMIQNIYVGQNASIAIEMIPQISTYLLNGYVTVSIADKPYNVYISNNVGYLNVSGLYCGNYPVNISYAGSDIYNAKDDAQYASIFVNKLYPSISVSVDSPIYVGNDSIINITMDSNNLDYVVNAYVTVTVDNKEYNVSIIDGKGSCVIKNLYSGIYDVNVAFAGNTIYNQIYDNKYATITVNKIPTSISMDNIELKVGDVANITATVDNSNVSGSMIFIVDNKEYVVGIVDGIAHLSVAGLNNSANRNITAKYSGDYKFLNSTADATLSITKVKSNASISVYDITAGETETVIINLPSDISNGTISVMFNNEEISGYLVSNNVISFNRTLQSAGTYSVGVSIVDDCKYDDFDNSTSFVVSKVAPGNYTIVIEVNDTHVFEKIPVIVTLPGDANETLSLSVDGVLVNDSVAVGNGAATYTLGNLSNGTHTISVTYENDKYETKSVSADIFVSKIASAIIITNPVDPRVGHEIIVNVTPVGSEGDITVTINNKTYIVNDRSWVKASGLLEGNYTVVVVLAEDENYFESTNNSVFFVSRNYVSMSLSNISGEVLVDSPIVLRADFNESVTGSVVFNVNGMNYTVNITESDFAEYTWIPLNEGNVLVSALYSGNDTYYPCDSEDITFKVSRNLAKFDEIIVSDIMVGDVENITVALNVTDVTGAVIFNVNGSEYESNVLGGLALLSIPDLSSGKYTVSIYYPGDRKYYAVNPYITEFTVSKYATPIDIATSDIMVLDNATVSVTLPGEINDLITITVGDKSTNVVLVNGTASLIISDLPAGNYTVGVVYSGNSKYLSNTSGSMFTVSKYNSTFDVNVSDVLWTDEDNNISMTLSEDATGDVTVSINGTDYVLPVVNGTVDFTIPELAPGDYEAVITYSGDNKYDPVSEAFNFTVNGNYPVIEADDVVKYYRGSERLRINLTNVRDDKLANETVYVRINGITYTRTTNENGSLSIPLNLPSGEYAVSVIYNTSSKYNPVTKIVNVTILSSIESSDLIKVYRNDSQFYAYFTDSEGNALANTSVKFNINGVFYTRTTNASGWAKLNINLPKGEYIITAYNPVTEESRSNVIDVLSRITENVDITMNYRDGTKFKVCIIDDNANHVGAGESVEFNINGVFYTRTTNSDGYATLNINLPAGQYIITTSYMGCLDSNTITIYD